MSLWKSQFTFYICSTLFGNHISESTRIILRRFVRLLSHSSAFKKKSYFHREREREFPLKWVFSCKIFLIYGGTLTISDRVMSPKNYTQKKKTLMSTAVGFTAGRANVKFIFEKLCQYLQGGYGMKVLNWTCLAYFHLDFIQTNCLKLTKQIVKLVIFVLLLRTNIPANLPGIL